jgi:O-antigen/teichoic acid export membrane protein
VLVANISSSLVKLIVASPAIFQNLSFTWNTRLWKDLLRFGLPTVPAVLFAMVVALGDRFLIKYFFDQATVGIYSAGYKIGMIMALMVTAFRFAWHPFFLSLADQENARETFARILTLFLIVGSFVFLLVSLLAPPVLTMDFNGKAIITPEYAEGLRIVPLILLAYLFQGVYVNLVVGMYLKKKTYLAPLFTGTGMVINLSTNLILMGVLDFGFIAAGIAALASYIGQSFLLWFVSRRFYPIPYEGTKMIKLALLVAVLFFLPQLIPGQALLISFVVVLAYFPLLPAVGVLSMTQIKTAARQLISRKSG